MLFALFMATLMLPIEVTLIPNVADHPQPRAGSTPTRASPLPFLATAFGTFLIRQGFLGIPQDLRDAAELDGFGHLAFLRRVAVPVTRPVIASFAVIASSPPGTSTSGRAPSSTEGSVGDHPDRAQGRLGQHRRPDNVGFAAALIAALPVLVLLIFLQRQLVRGLTAGAVKG